MKNIPRTLIISLIPFLTPLAAYAETEKQAESASPIAETKGNAASWRASQVIGLNVKNSGDELIGEVEDLVLDMKDGEILAVIISSGGFLGVADTLSAVPVTSLRYDDAAKAFKTKLTKEQLGKAPRFRKDAWPDYSEAISIEAMRSYRDSIGALAIPGVGPLIAAGPLLAARSGAAAGATVGGITGGLIGLGIPEMEAKSYENRIAEGNILLSVLTVSGDDVNRAKEIMKKAEAEDIFVTSIGELASSAKG